jgi:hypothetical protein
MSYTFRPAGVHDLPLLERWFRGDAVVETGEGPAVLMLYGE